MKKLNNNDYKKILKYYNINYTKNKKTNKKIAEDILANKLCRCIKAVKKNTKNESPAIAICKNSIFKKKNLNFYKFTCKKKPKLLKSKSHKHFKLYK